MARQVFIYMNTNCKWAEIRLLNGIRGLRVNKAIEQPGVKFTASSYALQCKGNDRENDVWAIFEAEFTGGGLPKIRVQCGSWNQTHAQFQWPGSKKFFYYCTAGPGHVADPQPYKECEIYISDIEEEVDALGADDGSEWGRTMTDQPFAEPD